MLYKFFITLFFILCTAPTGFCSAIVYSLAGHEFMAVQKGTLYISMTSTTSKTEINSSYYKDQTISLYSAFDLSDKFSLNLNLPYVNSKQSVKSVSYYGVEDDTIRGSGLGDISAGIKYQIIDQEERFADIFFHLTAISATGDSPYEDSTKLSTGSGGYSLKPEIAMAKEISNSMPFCSIFYQYNLKIDGLSYHRNTTDGEAGVYLEEVEPGDSYGISLGYVALINKNISVMTRYDYHKSKKSRHKWVGRPDYTGSIQDLSKIGTGLGFKFPSKLAIFTTLSFGIGEEAPDFEFEISVAL